MCTLCAGEVSDKCVLYVLERSVISVYSVCWRGQCVL